MARSFSTSSREIVRRSDFVTRLRGSDTSSSVASVYPLPLRRNRKSLGQPLTDFQSELAAAETWVTRRVAQDLKEEGPTRDRVLAPPLMAPLDVDSGPTVTIGC